MVPGYHMALTWGRWWVGSPGHQDSSILCLQKPQGLPPPEAGALSLSCFPFHSLGSRFGEGASGQISAQGLERVRKVQGHELRGQAVPLLSSCEW